MLTSTCITVSSLRPNTQYYCYIYGIDSFGRYGTALEITFTPSRIGKFDDILLSILLYSSLKICRADVAGWHEHPNNNYDAVSMDSCY